MSIDSLSGSLKRPIPKYAWVRDLIAARIYRGELSEGERLPSVKELIKLHAVSFATISRAMDELEQAGLIDKRWGQGMFVRAPRKAVQNIAVTFDSRYSVTHPRRVALCRGLFEAAERTAWDLQIFPLIRSAIFNGPSDLLLARLLKQGEFSGAICCSPHPVEDLKQMVALRLPLVLVAHQYPGLSVHSLGLDAEQTAAAALDYLAGLGHRRVGLVLAIPPAEPGDRRIRDSQRLAATLLTQVANRPEIALGEDVVFSDYDWQTACPAVYRWLSRPDRPTAIFCIEENLTISLMEMAADLGLRVPEDLSILGMGHLEQRGVSSLAAPSERIGRRAVELLSQLHAGETLPAGHHVFPSALVTQKSTGVAPPGR